MIHKDASFTLELCCKSLTAIIYIFLTGREETWSGAKRGVLSGAGEGLQAVRGPLIKKIQLFVYIHFPHSDYFINCPAFISSLPFPSPPLRLIISSFIQTNKHTIGALWIQRICFPF